LYKCDGSSYTVSWKQPTYLTKVSTVFNNAQNEQYEVQTRQVMYI